jgi:Zn-dependent protease with chaperone function
MSTSTFTFPPMPSGADKGILKPSKAFTRQVYKSIGAIFLFILTYLILLLGATAIAGAFIALGVVIISGLSSFMGLIAGVALMGSGLMLVFFTIKFLFKSTPADHSDMMEITPDEQPALFAFIKQLTDEAQAPFPKRIFISADVNAGVFYDSSFWSMFFPVKKNLKIGLGLVNCINLSEFKAIMAHEFGHFSQRSMKFGSYVYNLNKVIHNMLYENDGYGKLLNGFARIHSIFRLFAWINIQLVMGMQNILKKIYVVLNKTYMGLSREMEFHADAMAAYVSGSNHATSSLKRIEIGQLCYSGLLNYWNSQLAENKRSQNFYPQQLEMISHYAANHRLKADSIGLPIIDEHTNIGETSEVIINDQWSSHPSNEDRGAALTIINLNAPVVNEPAWVIFNNPEQLQILLTDEIYAGAKLNEGFSVINLEGFKADFYNAISQNSFHDAYKGYYDGRGITRFDVEDPINMVTDTTFTFEELFTDAHCSLPKTIERMEQDISTLNTLITAQNDIKTFDYKGNKYIKNEAQTISGLIDHERHESVKQLESLDKNIFIFFYNKSNTGEARDLLVAKYSLLFKYQADAIQDYDLYNKTMSVFNRVYNTMTADNINATLTEVYNFERTLKPRIAVVIADEETRAFMDEEQLKAADKYLASKWIYYYEPKYDNEAIGIFNKGVDAYISAVAKRNFEIKKDLLNFQYSLLNNK